LTTAVGDRFKGATRVEQRSGRDETEARSAGETDPLVTVVVPAYNHAQYVTECLDSVVGGSYRNIELIVINDASQDDTGQVIAEWIRRHLFFV